MTSTTTRAPLSIEQISLRVAPSSGADRAFVVGGSGSGKSTLMDVLGADFVRRYRARGGRRLILDSKPRYRAQFTVSGASAAKRYRRWAHGSAIPGSVVVDDPRDMRLAWETGARTVIVQGQSPAADIARLVLAARIFLDDAKATRPQLVQVDETMDFFHGNGAPKGGDDTLVQLPRAGRERGCASMFGAQRTHGISSLIMTELNRLYAFHLDYAKDATRLQEMGAPPVELPIEDHQFLYWWKGDKRRVWGPYRLDIPAK